MPRHAADSDDRLSSWCDRLLDLCVVGFAEWTIAYQLCLLLHIAAGWAATGTAVAFAACLPSVLRGERPVAALRSAARGPARARARWVVLVAAAVAATCFAFVHRSWPVAVGAWIVAAGLAAWTGGASARWPTRGSGPVAVALALALAVLASVLLNPNVDDTNYVHLATWVAAHGVFPLRDTLFSDQTLPALVFPPLNSYEALLGTIARVTGLSAPDVVYIAIPPIAAALSTLALWRVLRSWRVRTPALALCVAVAFLLFDAATMREFGAFWLPRIWQGKAIFVSVLVPLLFALLHDHAQQPTRRRLLLLLAASVAGVGLTTTAMFLVPVIAVGALAPLLLTQRRRVATAALAATIGYPLAAALFTLAVGGRNPQVYTASEVVPSKLAHDVVGHGLLALVAVVAVLAAPVLVTGAAARMLAGVALAVGVLFLPHVMLTIFHLTGLGEVLWRLTWALPIPALVGLLAVELPARVPWRAARVLAPAAVATAIVLGGTPVWSKAAGTTVATPRLKLPPGTAAQARLALAGARPGDVVLAPHLVSQAILDVSGTVVVVDPLDRYAHALSGVPGGDAPQRLLLERLVDGGLAPLQSSRGRLAADHGVRAALRELHVDIACVPTAQAGTWRLLRGDRFAPVSASGGLRCLRLAASGRQRGTLVDAAGG